MAWTTPRTWVDGETVSQSEMNAHVRDNTDFLFTAATKPDQNAQTGTGSSAYTFVLADATGGKIVIANAASAATYTVPQDSSVAWPAGSVIRVVSIGAGVITFAAGSGATVNNTAATLSQYDAATLVKTAANTWQVIKGGGIPKASYSSTTGSPTITTVGSSTCIKFTGDGSLTTNAAGKATLLVQAGGGGGATNGFDGAGGGAGGFLTQEIWLAASTTYTVKIGAGGAVNANGGASYFASVGTAGGGTGGAETGTKAGSNGGCGGGGFDTGAGGLSLIASQGFAGGAGASNTNSSAGGGGTSQAGADAGATDGGKGGDGTVSTITGSSVTYGGGGGGGSRAGTAGAGGAGGGGKGQDGTAAVAGGTNTGGGGGGAGEARVPNAAAAGGSGVVIVLL